MPGGRAQAISREVILTLIRAHSGRARLTLSNRGGAPPRLNDIGQKWQPFGAIALGRVRRVTRLIPMLDFERTGHLVLRHRRGLMRENGGSRYRLGVDRGRVPGDGLASFPFHLQVDLSRRTR